MMSLYKLNEQYAIKVNIMIPDQHVIKMLFLMHNDQLIKKAV